MKKIYLLLLLSVFFASSCTDLDVDPVSTITDKNYWKSPEHFDAFMYGVHSRFRTHSWNFVLLGEARSDIYGDQPFGGEASQGMERFPYNTISSEFTGISNYGEFYTNINQLNLFIKKTLETSVLSDNERQYYLGQAYGLRAYYFFHLYRSWGDVVFTEEPSERFEVGKLDKATTPAVEIFDRIKQDIESSLTAFGNNYDIKENKSMWSKPATLMLKAEVYLWSSRQLAGGMSDAGIVKVTLTDIEANVPNLKLMDKYTDIFEYENKGNNEIIFAIHNQLNESNLFNGSYRANLLPGDLYIRNYYDETGEKINTAVENNFGLMRLQIKVSNYNLFDDKDSRKRATIKGVYDIKDGQLILIGTYPKKYPGTMNGSVRVAADDFPIYRYADLLLMLAEAKAILGEDPEKEINAIRKRAFGDNYDNTISYPNQPIDANIDEAILQERFFEFLIEGKRWYDLRRYGNDYVFKYTLADPKQPLKLLWPIDKSTLTKNPALNQTLGY
ncbi:MAG: SusD family outer membrane lipoprotein NanU [Dysgonomonas sp.]|nr:SusD family outer membrane lipoprotein NanU [Dysgonomonas sp.]